MAGRGPAPDPNSKRTELRGGTRPVGAKVDAPPLPNAANYTPATLAWYERWCSAPQASEFIATDWQRLFFVADLVEAYHLTDDPSLKLRLMAEIRQNEAKLGATPEDRQRLRWKIADVGGDEKGDKPSPSRARKDPRKT